MRDDLTAEQVQIKKAYDLIIAHIQTTYEGYMRDAEESPADYEGIDADNAYIWFVESF